MGSYFLDSSAIVKRYVAEVGSAWVIDLVDPVRPNHLYIARIAGVEVVAALARRSLQHPSSRVSLLNAIAAFRTDLMSRFNVVEVSSAVISAAMDLAERHLLRGYDSVQLAAAAQVHGEHSALGASCVLDSADLELNAAARIEGLLVDNPNVYP